MDGVIHATLVGLLCLLLTLSSCRSAGDTVAAPSSAPTPADSIDVDRVDVDRVDASGWTPLMRAAARDDAAAIEALLDAGADLAMAAPEDLRAWHIAAIADAVGALDALRSAGADLAVRSTNGMDTLDHAAASGSVQVIEYLAADDPDLDARSAAVSQGHGYPADRGSTPLGLATRAGSVDAVAALLAAGADVDAMSASGNTPLLIAVFSDQPPEIVALLLDHGADTTVLAACVERCAGPPGDALSWAERLERDELVPILRSATS